MGYHLNRLDEPFFMAVPKPLLTEFGVHYRLESCGLLCLIFEKLIPILITTLQSIMNAKLSKQRFWHCHENGLIKTNQTIPHKLGECQVDFPLLWIKDYPGLS